MNKVKRAYAAGDRVISLVPLVAPPEEAWHVGVEIPAGSVGMVTDVREYTYLYPYRVSFEVGVDARIEISVKEDAVMAASLDDAKPDDFHVPAPVPQEKPAHAPFQPTKARPHRNCGMYHKGNGVVFTVGTVTALIVEPVVALTVGGVLAMASLLLYLTQRQQIHATMKDNELPVTVDTAWASRAVLTDHIYGWCLFLLVSSVVFQEIMKAHHRLPTLLGGNVIYQAAIATFAVWMIKEAAHTRATITVDTYDD